MIRSMITLLLLLPYTLLSRHVKPSTFRKRKSASGALAQKIGRHPSSSLESLVHQYGSVRAVDCPVCSRQEIEQCDWDIVNDPTCQLVKVSRDCDCCPKCKAKEGEVCGPVESDRPGYKMASNVPCENDLKCSSTIKQGVCERIEGIDGLEIPDIDVLYDWYKNYGNDEDYTQEPESLELAPGCTEHVVALTTVEFYYTAAPLGVEQWRPICQAEPKSELYKPVQCRTKEESRESVCWCVNEETGVPTVHRHWSPKEISDEMCIKLAEELDGERRFSQIEAGERHKGRQ